MLAKYSSKKDDLVNKRKIYGKNYHSPLRKKGGSISPVRGYHR